MDKDRKKVKNPELDREAELLEKCKATLERDTPLRELTLDADEEKRIRGFQFLSQKPILYVLNLGEEDASRLHEKEEEFRKLLGAKPNTAVAGVAGKIEAELAELSPEEAKEYLVSYGLGGIGARAIDLGDLHAARTDVLSHGGRDGSAGLDDTDRQHGGQGGGRDPLRFREEVHTRGSGELEIAGRSGRISRESARRGCCAWRARSTS